MNHEHTIAAGVVFRRSDIAHHYDVDVAIQRTQSAALVQRLAGPVARVQPRWASAGAYRRLDRGKERRPFRYGE